MGILNATPNSFYNKGQDSDINGLLRNAEKMLNEGATILDIGGASTKPGEGLINADDELARVLPVVTAIHQHFPDAWLSIDTYNARVATETVAAGISIVNDVSAGQFDAGMMKAVAKLKVPYIAMHIKGIPKTMQADPRYDDVNKEVREYLATAIQQCETAGIHDIIIDPGFGFGKTNEHNFSLLRSMHDLRLLGKPILAGISRKSMICKTLRVNPEYALNGTTALHMVAMQQGASILRAHDVKEAMQVIELYKWVAGNQYS
jgi:dihydropteroate synthase